MRLMIAIPCADTIRYEFAESLSKLELQLAEDGIDFDVKWIASSLIYMARDDLALAAHDGGFTHVLWLDSDMQFSRDIFNILRSVDKPFVTAIYRSRRSPYAYCLFSDNERSLRVLKIPDEPFEIQACGFGCCLMSVEVLRQVRRHCGLWFLPTVAAGEDVAFCDRYIQSGGHIYAVPDAKANHICYVPLRCDDPSLLVQYKEQR